MSRPEKDAPGADVNVVQGLAVALAVYLMATFHRTSLGVAGLEARERFDISPAQLSVFIFVQIGVYASMQIPVGILVDKFGPRRLLLAAAAVMGLAQLAFAFVPNYGGALVARGILGVGDALTFVSVLRFAAEHVSPRRYPMIVAMTGALGALGNIAATVPLTLALLSPAHRPIQVTKDLPGFWKGSWRDVRADMRGRYPRHVWPEDPSQAVPTTRAKPRGT
mgnify:CR=1 FL=1